MRPDRRWRDLLLGLGRRRRALLLIGAGISLRATREGERRQTVPSWGSARGVEAAINGDFFSYSTYLPIGAAAGDGRVWGPADGNGHGFVAVGTDRAYLSRDAEVVNPLPGWMRQVVSGKPLILREGEVVDHGGRELCTVRHPRTAAGFSRDWQTLYLMVVDGRSTRSIGMTCAEEARCSASSARGTRSTWTAAARRPCGSAARAW